ncbi:MAG: hypothetical protein ACU83N_06160 [Gammaproteobacteria bacterium]
MPNNTSTKHGDFRPDAERKKDASDDAPMLGAVNPVYSDTRIRKDGERIIWSVSADIVHGV